MDEKNDLTVEQVAKIVGCHRNTILRLEKEGYASPLRDRNGHRRFTMREARRLKEIFNIRKPN